MLLLFAFICGLAIWGNWLPTRSYSMFFAPETIFKDVFGEDIRNYVPDKIQARYSEVRSEILAVSHSPDRDLRILQAFRYDAMEVYERVLERAAELAREQTKERQRQTASQATESFSAAGGWRAILGLSATETDVAAVKYAYRKLVRTVFPDFGGSHEQATTVINAYKAAKMELGFV